MPGQATVNFSNDGSEQLDAACHDLALFEEMFASVGRGDHSAGLSDQEASRRQIPSLEFKLEVGVQPARRHVGEILSLIHI